MTWAVERFAEAASAFHARPMPDPMPRAVWVCDPTGPALVLGSAQRDAVVDAAACRRAGVEVVRRRSGGGAVLVEPDSLLWLDVLVPASDPLWERDVGQAFLWLGEAWARALVDLGVETSVHRGPMGRSRWSGLVCFAGLGPGELTDTTGRKVLGISQRRTRAGARFQCVAPATWDPTRLVDLLTMSPVERASAVMELTDVAAGVDVAAPALLRSFLAHLP